MRPHWQHRTSCSMCPRTHRASCSMCPPPGGQMSLPVLVSEVLGGRTWFVCGGGRADVGVPTCPCRYVLGEGSRSGDPWRMGRGRERPTWLPRQRGQRKGQAKLVAHAEGGRGQPGYPCRENSRAFRCERQPASTRPMPRDQSPRGQVQIRCQEVSWSPRSFLLSP